MTEESAAALLDRGVPFTLTTTNPGSGHLQAVIGVDGRRGTFWIRDPFLRNVREAIADALLEQYRAYGPRGMAMVPMEQRTRLDGLELPDASLWDRLHELDAALVGHRRDDADALVARIEAQADGHRIGREARLRMARYDADQTEILECVDRLLELSLKDPGLQLERLGCLRELARRNDRLAMYRTICEARRPHPIFLQQYAQELQADARRHAEAIELLRRAIRAGPEDAGSYYILANILWDDRRFDKAFELYRFATCLNDKEEAFAESYFRAAQWFKKTDEALAFLRGRFERFGRKSSAPARTLARAYMHLNRTTDALAMVEEALSLRPDDGDFVLFSAGMYAGASGKNMPKALALVKKAKGSASRAQWLRTAARLETQAGRPAAALGHWRKLLAIQPLAVDVHQAIAQLLSATQDRPAALKHLAEAVDRFPHHLPLQQLWLQWLRDERASLCESALRNAVALHPHDAWLRRELAFFLVGARRFAEATVEAEAAGGLEPLNPSQCYLQAKIHRGEGRLAEAKKALREAVLLSVDFALAIDDWMSICTTLAERREVLATVQSELVRQVIFGGGLLAFRRHAHGVLGPLELWDLLNQMLQDRPDLWQVWSACVQQLLGMGSRESALEIARKATERFPLLPVLWLERASACRACEDWRGERAALETAHQINPDWGEAVRALADFHERQGEFRESLDLLEAAVARQPLEINNQIMLAETRWRRKRQDAAIRAIRHTIELHPGYDRAWDDLRRWATEAGHREYATEAARKLTKSRAGEARSWLVLGEMLDGPAERDERLAALEKAISLNPHLVEAHRLRAITLAAAMRWEEARQACRPAVFGDQPPVVLRSMRRLD